MSDNAFIEAFNSTIQPYIDTIKSTLTRQETKRFNLMFILLIFVTGILILVHYFDLSSIFFFFALLNGKDLIDYFKSVMPIDAKEVNFVFSEVTNVMSVVFYSILFSAIFQGTLFAFVGMYFGYDGLLLGIFYGFASLIPLVGGALMWVPLCAIEIAHGNTTAALVIALYSIIVISIVADTFIKPLIIKYINDKMVKTPTTVNELLIFFAIFAGLSTFGFWGMILGPAITTLFISLLKLYKLLKEKHYM